MVNCRLQFYLKYKKKNKKISTVTFQLSFSITYPHHLFYDRVFAAFRKRVQRIYGNLLLCVFILAGIPYDGIFFFGLYATDDKNEKKNLQIQRPFSTKKNLRKKKTQLQLFLFVNFLTKTLIRFSETEIILKVENDVQEHFHVIQIHYTLSK